MKISSGLRRQAGVFTRGLKRLATAWELRSAARSPSGRPGASLAHGAEGGASSGRLPQALFGSTPSSSSSSPPATISL